MSLIDFNSEQKLIESEIKRFSQIEIEPQSSEIEKKGIFPTEIIKKLSDLGFLSLIIPEKYGGASLDTTSLCIVLEELSKVCASIGTILAVNNCLVAYPLLKYASEEKKEYYLPKLAKGTIGAHVTELGINSSDRKVEIREAGGNNYLSGKWNFVLNGEVADFFVIPISLTDHKTLYLFERNSNINSIKHDILGLKTAGIVGIELNNLELKEDDYLLSGEDIGGSFQGVLNYSNIGFSAISLGIAEAAYDASVNYSKERRQFGRAICEFPMIQDMLVEMKTKIDAAKLLVYTAAAKCDDEQYYSLQACIARLQSGAAAVYSGIKAIQIHGGYGYTKEYPVERYLREAKVIQVLHQTPYDLKLIIAKELLR